MCNPKRPRMPRCNEWRPLYSVVGVGRKLRGRSEAGWQAAMQGGVRDMYMRVIDMTIENARVEWTEAKADDEALTSLDALKNRWRERLLHVQDFSEDPLIVRTSAAGNARARSSARGTRGAPAAAAAPPGSISSLIGPTAPPYPYGGAAAQAGALGSNGVKVEGAAVGAGGAKRDASQLAHVANGGGQQPAAKRPRRPDDDEAAYNCNSDLGSSSDESDDEYSAGSDPEVDNYILAQHDRVRKGAGKWKVQLKEGIAHINGRDYLFNKATCDLDW